MLRLVVISLLIPADTSECERIFSLMNDIKTAERNRMGQQNLTNLMLWHFVARKMEEDGTRSSAAISHSDVPVMAILKEFREMAGVKGRNVHRGTDPPTYEYEKHHTSRKA